MDQTEGDQFAAAETVRLSAALLRNGEAARYVNIAIAGDQARVFVLVEPGTDRHWIGSITELGAYLAALHAPAPA